MLLVTEGSFPLTISSLNNERILVGTYEKGCMVNLGANKPIETTQKKCVNNSNKNNKKGLAGHKNSY